MSGQQTMFRTLAFILVLAPACFAQVERRVDLGDGYDAAMIANHSRQAEVVHRNVMRQEFKTVTALLFALYAFSVVLGGAERVEKPALLLIPEVVSMGQHIAASVEFRWDEDMPVTLDVLVLANEVSTLGDLTVYDENGKEVPMSFPMSLPPAPNGKKTVSRGEVLRVALSWTGSVDFPKPGRYYAVAVFSSAFTETSNVCFTTRKRWFQVVDAAPKTA